MANLFKVVNVATKTTYTGLATKDPGTLYLITDTKEVFLGANPYGVSVFFVDALPATGIVDKLYVNKTDGSASFWNGTSFTTIAGNQESLPAGLLLLKGGLDASAPDFTSSLKGDTYIITTAGVIESVDFNIGDQLIMVKDYDASIDATYFVKIDNTESPDIMRIANGITPTDGNITSFKIVDGKTTINDSGLSKATYVAKLNEGVEDLNISDTELTTAKAVNDAFIYYLSVENI